MIARETIAALVSILGGVVAVLIWAFGKISALKLENTQLRDQLAAHEIAPRQPLGCDYLEDSDGSPICVHCRGAGRIAGD